MKAAGAMAVGGREGGGVDRAAARRRAGSKGSYRGRDIGFGENWLAVVTGGDDIWPEYLGTGDIGSYIVVGIVRVGIGTDDTDPLVDEGPLSKETEPGALEYD